MYLFSEITDTVFNSDIPYTKLQKDYIIGQYISNRNKFYELFVKPFKFQDEILEYSDNDATFEFEIIDFLL